MLAIKLDDDTVYDLNMLRVLGLPEERLKAAIAAGELVGRPWGRGNHLVAGWRVREWLEGKTPQGQDGRP